MSIKDITLLLLILFIIHCRSTVDLKVAIKEVYTSTCTHTHTRARAHARTHTHLHCKQYPHCYCHSYPKSTSNDGEEEAKLIDGEVRWVVTVGLEGRGGTTQSIDDGCTNIQFDVGNISRSCHAKFAPPPPIIRPPAEPKQQPKWFPLC